MRTKVDVQSLKIGMYVDALDRSWLGTPFLFQGFEIQSQNDIEELRRYCTWVYVKTPEQPAPKLHRRPVTPADTIRPVSEADKNYEHDALRIVNRPSAAPVYPDRTTLEQELGEARRMYEDTRVLIYETMEDARLGKAVNTIGAKKIVGMAVESVIRNPDALISFTQLKRKDEYTALHSLRVCILALAFGRHLGMERIELEQLGIGALLHDVGKAQIPKELLDKPEKLTDTEFMLMKDHVTFGINILEHSPRIPSAALEVVRNHHERYSGGGYLNGLQGDAIGFYGMIGGIVDTYDALTSDRAFRKGMAAHTALKNMYEWRGRDFHPQLVEQFIQCMGIYPIGSVVELNTGEIGVVINMNRTRRLRPCVALVLKNNYMPYPVPRLFDLATHRTNNGRTCEIERVLDPGAHGIDPIKYLPLNEPQLFESLAVSS